MSQKLSKIAAIVAGLVCVPMFATGNVSAQSPMPAGDSVPVTLDNFIRAESDMYLAGVAKDYGLGKLGHNREPASIDHQTVIRLNRDTLYSGGVFDLDAGPVTITLPDAGKRFRSMQVINEDHYVVGDVEYEPGSYTYGKNDVGTRYVVIALRHLVDPNDPGDLRAVHALQDSVKTEQAATGKFEVPAWDPATQKKIRDALLVLGSTTSGFKNSFGEEDDVDPIYHLIGTAMGWGGNPEKDAKYISVTPDKNDGTTVYKLAVKDVPVDGFWSVSLYNAKGYYEKNAYDAYSLNNITADKSDDGTVNIQFGGCDGKIANCLPIMPRWNYTVRLYRPREEILKGAWTFPEPQPVVAEAQGSAATGSSSGTSGRK